MGRIAGLFGRSKTTVLAVIVAVVLVGAPAALAANGKPFILGKKNTATKVSTLAKRGAGPALSLVVGSGAPLAVNSAVKVVNLNADRLDGLDSTAFLRTTGKAADAEKLDGKNSTQFAQDANQNGKADDAEQADQASNATNANSANTANIANNANSLGGFSPSAYGRPIAFGMTQLRASLVAGDNFILAPAFTPPTSGKCLVTLSTQISGTPNTIYSGPSYRAAIKQGTASPTSDGLYGHYFQQFSGYVSSDMTRSAIFNVNGGEPTQLGAYLYLGNTGPEWQGDQADVHVTYWCTTPGSGAIGGTAATTEAKALANEQEAGR